MSKETEMEEGRGGEGWVSGEWWFCILVRRGEHKGCWITCTSPSFSSSLLFFLYCGWWTLKKRWRKGGSHGPGFKAAAATTPQSKGFRGYDQNSIWVPPSSSSPSFHAYEDPPLTSITYKAVPKVAFFFLMTANNATYKLLVWLGNRYPMSSKFGEIFMGLWSEGEKICSFGGMHLSWNHLHDLAPFTWFFYIFP